MADWDYIKSLERNSERLDRDFRIGDKPFRLRPENSVQRYAIKIGAAIVLTAALAYMGYRIVNSGGKTIEHWIDRMSEYYPKE